MSDLVQVQRDARGVVTVTLNRPQSRNALSLATNQRLAAIARELGDDASVRVVVITGSGDKAFCAGADLKERRGVSAAESGPYVDAIGGAIDAWAKMPKVSLAAINGSAFGGGMELALACDIRIASTNAEFGLTEVRLGIMPGAGGTQRLSRLLGVARAKELVLLGKRISASEAAALGLVVAAVPQDDLADAVDGLVGQLLAGAPLSLAKAKEAIDTGFDLALDDALRVERACYEVTLFSQDRDEGLRAFAEKRPPVYIGK